jgi:hypothetical protein
MPSAKSTWLDSKRLIVAWTRGTTEAADFKRWTRFKHMASQTIEHCSAPLLSRVSPAYRKALDFRFGTRVSAFKTNAKLRKTAPIHAIALMQLDGCPTASAIGRVLPVSRGETSNCDPPAQLFCAGLPEHRPVSGEEND